MTSLDTQLPPGGTVVWGLGEQLDPFGLLLDPVAGAPTFIIGESDPVNDWAPYHPGFLHGGTGFRPVSREIVFDLREPLAAAYELYLRLYLNVGPAPELLVELNDWSGLYFLDPERPDYEGILGLPCPIAGYQTLRIPFPGAAARAGRNTLRLTTVHTGTPIDAHEHALLEPPWLGGATFMYCRVELRQLPELPPSEPVASLNPLPLYVQRDDGGLDELVELVVTAPQGFAEATATIHIGDHRLATPLDLEGRHGGQVRKELRVPELAGPAPATVELVVDGTTTSFETELRPHRKWTVHVMPHVHLDLGFTDFQGKVAEVHSRNLERAVDLLDSDHEFAFTVDGSFGVQKLLETRNPERIERILSAMRGGRIGVNAFYALLVTGLSTLEELYRAGYFSAWLRRHHGVPVDYANITDVPSYSWAFPSAIKAMGIDHLMAVPNHGISSNKDCDVQHLVSPCRWKGPDGAEVLTFFADVYGQFGEIAGNPPTVASAERGLHLLLRRFERDDYLPSDFPLFGTHGDNEDLGHGKVGDFTARWNARFAYPRLRVSTIADYFRAVAPLAPELPEFGGDGGSYWEAAAGTAALATVQHRRAQVALPVTEAVFGLMGLVDDQLRPPRDRLDRAWEGLVIACEHTWGALDSLTHSHSEASIDQIHWKIDQIAATTRIVTDETRRAMSQLGELVTTHGPSLLVFNSLSWSRGAEVEAEVPPGAGIVTAEGDPVAVAVIGEIDSGDAGYLFGEGRKRERIRFRADDLPGFGYRSYRVAHGQRVPGQAPWEAVTGPVETERYRATIDPATGRLTSLVHKHLDRELLDASSAYALGEPIVVRGGLTEPHPHGRLRLTTMSWPNPVLNRPEPVELRPEMGWAGVRRTPWGAVIRLTGSGPGISDLRTDITLRDDSDRVDVDLSFHKHDTRGEDSLYVAFPFALSSPELRYDRQQGWVDPSVDHQPGANNEFFTTLFGVAVSEPDLTVSWVPLDAPLFASGHIPLGEWPLHFECQNGSLFSWVIRFGGTPQVHDGNFHLRHAFTVSRTFDPAAASRFGREVRTPAVLAEHSWHDKADVRPRPLPLGGGSLYPLDLPDGLIASVHGAVEGDGLVVRVQEIAGSPADASLPLPAEGLEAVRCTATEDPIEPVPAEAGGVAVELGPYEVATFRFARRALVTGDRSLP